MEAGEVGQLDPDELLWDNVTGELTDASSGAWNIGGERGDFDIVGDLGDVSADGGDRYVTMLLRFDAVTRGDTWSTEFLLRLGRR